MTDPPIPTGQDPEEAYRHQMADLARSHKHWRSMMRLALWASVLAMLFARLNASTFAFVVAAVGFAAGIFCFYKVWTTRRQMIRLRDQHRPPAAAAPVD